MGSKMQRYYTKEGQQINNYPEILNLLNQDRDSQNFVELGKIKMVGSYMLSDGSVWYSFPKFYPVDTNNPTSKDKDFIDKVIKVIEKLRANGKNLFEGDRIFSPDVRSQSKRTVNIVELSKYIVKDYLQYGIYYRKEISYKSQGCGKNNWGKTIKKERPIIDVDVVYGRIWKKHTTIDMDNKISQIHIAIVCDAIKIYEKVHSNREIKAPIYDCTISMDRINEKGAISLLNEEILHVYSDREQAIIKAMIAWCGLTNNYRYAGCTNCFQNVWEWINDEVFGNVKNTESDYPEYYIYDDVHIEEYYRGKGQARPDTIYLDRNKTNGKLQLYVYDSKYYVPQFDVDKSEVYHFPANSDILKQVEYLRRINRSLSNYIKEEIEMKNIFLIPELTDEEMKNIGRTKSNRELLWEEIGYSKAANFDFLARTVANSMGFDINIEVEHEELSTDRVYIWYIVIDYLMLF